MTIDQILNLAITKLQKEKINSSALDAEILLQEAFEKIGKTISRACFYRNPRKTVSDKTIQIFENLIARRLKHEPLSYIIGHKEFYGLDFIVNNYVLTPRPETELLVEQALFEIRKKLTSCKEIKVADIGTGSGCIIIALAKRLEKYASQIKFAATDISSSALKIAKLNAEKHNTKTIKFYKGHLTYPLYKKQDIIIANLPYLDANYKNLLTSSDFRGLIYEPKIAWYGGKNGTLYYRRFFKEAFKKLAKDGIILCEIGHAQTYIIKKYIKYYIKNTKIQVIKDYQNFDRIIKIQIKK